MSVQVKASDKWTMNLPVPVEFGVGCVEKMPTYLDGCKRALVVSQLVGTPAEYIVEQICNVLNKAGLETKIFHDFAPESNHDEIERGAELAREFDADVIVGCGGGSSMDAAKLVALGASHPEPLLTYRVGGTNEITKTTLRTIAVTSTSGSGSHIGRVAVVSENEKSLKRFMASDFLYPRAAFCDPLVLKEMPREVTITSGFDAFAQALEGYLSGREHPMGNVCAQEALRIVAETLPMVLEDGDNLDLRTAMAWADTLGAVSVATNAVLTAHVIGMVLGGRYHMPHGRAVSVVTVAALRHSRNGAIGKLATIARLMGCNKSLSQEGLADWAINAIESFIHSIDLGKNLKDYGVPEKDFRKIAEEVKANFSIRLDVDPVEKKIEDLIWILEQSSN